MVNKNSLQSFISKYYLNGRFNAVKWRIDNNILTVYAGESGRVCKVELNDLLRLWGLDKNHNLITFTDKVKWIYLKDNPYKIEGLAFLDYDMPDKIKEFLALFADRKRIFDSILLLKLEGFFSDLGWSLDLNPYVNAFESFEI